MNQLRVLEQVRQLPGNRPVDRRRSLAAADNQQQFLVGGNAEPAAARGAVGTVELGPQRQSADDRAPARNALAGVGVHAADQIGDAGLETDRQPRAPVERQEQQRQAEGARRQRPGD